MAGEAPSEPASHRCLVDLDDVPVGVGQENLRKTCKSGLLDDQALVVLGRKVGAVTLGLEVGERLVEIAGAQGEMHVVIVDRLAAEIAGRMLRDVDLQRAEPIPDAGDGEGRAGDAPEAENVFVEGGGPVDLVDDDGHMMQCKFGHGDLRVGEGGRWHGGVAWGRARWLVERFSLDLLTIRSWVSETLYQVLQA